MGWPFQSSSQKKTPETKAVSSQRGFLGKLLGGASEKQAPETAPKGQQPVNQFNQWDLPDESFDAVAKLLEETRQKSPSQPLQINPYRTSLTLDDDESASQVQMNTVKADSKSWAFDPSQLNLGKEQADTLSSDFLEPASILEPVTDNQLPFEQEAESEIQPLEIQPEDERDDFGLGLSPQALPAGSSLRELIHHNVLTFISGTQSQECFCVDSQSVEAFSGTEIPLEIPANEYGQFAGGGEADWLSVPAEVQTLFQDTDSMPLQSSDPFDNAVLAVDDWLKASTGEEESASVAFGFEENLDLMVKSVDDLPEELFEEELSFAIADSEPDELLQLNVYTEASCPALGASDTVVNESSWLEGGFPADTVFAQQYEPEDVQYAAMDDLVALGEAYYSLDTNQNDDFQVIALDPDVDTSDSASAFFSNASQYQFSLDDLNEAEYKTSDEHGQLYGFDEPALFGAEALEPEHHQPPEAGLFDFQPLQDTLSLDLDEDAMSYQSPLGQESLSLEGDEAVFELSDSFSFASEEILLPVFESSEGVDSSVPDTSSTSMVAEVCLEPPPLVQANALPEELPVEKPVEKRLSPQIVACEANVLWKESRFIKRSIDHLVEQYFASKTD